MIAEPFDKPVAEELSHEKFLQMRKQRFRILVCIDGSDESYRGLRYAARLSHRSDSDIVLLYVRALDQGLRSGGLEVRVARENMLNWGLELPGIKYLKKGLDLLMEEFDPEDKWDERATHVDVEGDPLGDNKIEYLNENGNTIVLKLKTATDIASGILDQYDLGPYNLIIMGESSRWRGKATKMWDPAVAEKIAIHAPCSVLVTRDFEGGHGHIVCTDGSEKSMLMVHRVGDIVTRLKGTVTLLSVALDDNAVKEAEKIVSLAKLALETRNIPVTDAITRTGNPVDEIVAAGADYSLIVVSDTSKSGLKRFFMGSVAFQVLETAQNSVMVVR